MKISKSLTICFVVWCLFIGNAFSVECSVALNDSLGPSGNTYQDGDTVEYVVSLSIANLGNCDITNIEVYFFDPNNPPDGGDECDATNGVLVFDGGSLELAYGEPAIVITSSEAAALGYTVDESDADGSGFIRAFICTKFDAITDLGTVPNEDDKESINAVISPDFMVDKACVNPDGTLIGEDAIFKITITNTGNTPLTFYDTGTELDAYEPIELDPLGVFDANVLVPTDGECEDDLEVSNTVEVAAFLESDPNEPFNVKSDSADCPVICPPSFTVEKICLIEPLIDEPNALFQITITNTGYIPLDFEIDDEAAGIVDLELGPIAPGDSNSLIVEVPAVCENGTVDNRVIVQAFYDDSPVLDPMPADAECACGQEGCTPGYWKNSTDCWTCYSPGTKLKDVFTFATGVSSRFDAIGNYTMLQALKFRGGRYKSDKIKLLLRQAVAAILSACNEDVYYPATEAGIIAAVNEILTNPANFSISEINALKWDYAMMNELGCPLSSENSANPCERNVEPD